MSRAPLDMKYFMRYNTVEFGKHGETPSSRHSGRSNLISNASLPTPQLEWQYRAKPWFVSDQGF
jgi:hypothetical protein